MVLIQAVSDSAVVLRPVNEDLFDVTLRSWLRHRLGDGAALAFNRCDGGEPVKISINQCRFPHKQQIKQTLQTQTQLSAFVSSFFLHHQGADSHTDTQQAFYNRHTHAYITQHSN